MISGELYSIGLQVTIVIVKNKNPEDVIGWTPFHFASKIPALELSQR